MIVRISGEDQYRLEEAAHADLNKLDSAVLTAIDSGDEAAAAPIGRRTIRHRRGGLPGVAFQALAGAGEGHHLTSPEESRHVGLYLSYN